jgi:glycosyltransferase involved in cell wall biosynthesis
MQFATALAERGDIAEVIALGRPGQPSSERIGGVVIRRLCVRNVDERNRLTYLMRVLIFCFRSALFLTIHQLWHPYDVIHVQSVPDFLVFTATIAKLLGARVILDIHELVPELYAAKFNDGRRSAGFRGLLYIEKLTAAFADHVMIPNPLWYARIVARSSRAEKCSLMRYLADPKIFYPWPRQRSDDRFLIIYPGTLNLHQGLDVGIRAFARVARFIPDAELHIYGEGPTKAKLKDMAESLGLTGRIRFFDMVPKNRLPELLCEYDLAIVPKRGSCAFGNEAESTKILELMATGVPVIVSKTKIDSVYYSSETVQFFESENDANLAESILLVASDPILWARLVAKGREYFQQNNWETLKPKYFGILNSLDGHRKTVLKPVNSDVSDGPPQVLTT